MWAREPKSRSADGPASGAPELKQRRAGHLGYLSVASLLGATVGHLRSRQVAALLAQDAEIEHAGDMATFVRSGERGLGASQISHLDQQPTEAERGTGVPPLVGAAESGLGTG